ncbi:hypothetical protein [Lysobacter sp. Hz 25]|uniref:hypothetical protein n=1 Tax=Lysobacter sp. Hz 25 TaxID=3383698 RepID=UPI0038D46A9A
MKHRLLAIICASVFLTACVRHTASNPFLQPCVIEGDHASLVEVMLDPVSTTKSIINFAGQAEDAVTRCNGQLESARKLEGGKP